jgi:hypothetical protein
VGLGTESESEPRFISSGKLWTRQNLHGAHRAGQRASLLAFLENGERGERLVNCGETERLDEQSCLVFLLKAERTRSESAETTPLQRTATTSRRQGLLDRIKLPTYPAGRNRARMPATSSTRSAAARRTSSFLAGGGHVRDSVRSEIPREEVEMCLEILSDTKVAGEWISICHCRHTQQDATGPESRLPPPLDQRLHGARVLS